MAPWHVGCLRVSCNTSSLARFVAWWRWVLFFLKKLSKFWFAASGPSIFDGGITVGFRCQGESFCFREKNAQLTVETPSTFGCIHRASTRGTVSEERQEMRDIEIKRKSRGTCSGLAGGTQGKPYGSSAPRYRQPFALLQGGSIGEHDPPSISPIPSADEVLVAFNPAADKLYTPNPNSGLGP